MFEAEAPADSRPRIAIARARAYSRGELDTAGEIRRRFVAGPDHPEAVSEEIRWQLAHMSATARAAVQQLPPVGEDSSGPLGPGLLAIGDLGSIIRELQAGLTDLGRAD